MVRYLIVSKHTPEQCLRALDEELSKGADGLDKFVYGCKDGDHTGYAAATVKSLSEALALVPDFLEGSACVMKVDKFTPADIKAFHAQTA